jgi:hypothetical protein
MKKFIFTLGLLLSLSALHAQGIIRGNVFDKESGEPIPFASVGIKNSTIGDDTDEAGFFSIAEVPNGPQTVTVSYVGYEDFSFEVDVRKGGITYKAVYLIASGIQLDQVEISGKKDQAKTEVQISKVQVTAKQIKAMPTTSGDADIAQYLPVLPGVIVSGDQGGQIYIRGGAPIQNKILLDGITIYNPFHSIGFFSVFETEIIRNADVLTGGFNAEYAGRVSAIVDIKTREGNKKRFSGIASVSPFQSKLLIEGPIAKLKETGGGSTSFILTGKHSYLDRTSPTLYSYATPDGQGLPFGFTDLYGKLSFVAENGTKLNLFGFNFRDRVNYQNTADINWNTTGVGASFLLIPSSTNLVIGGTLNYSGYEIGLQQIGQDLRTSGLDGFNVGMDFTYYGAVTEIKYGFELNGFRTNFNFRNQLGITINQFENNTEIGGFMKIKYRFGNLVVEPGLRLQYYASLNNFSFEPRIGAKVNLSDNVRLKFAGGIYSQNLISTVNERDIVNLFVGFLSGPDEILYQPNSSQRTDHKLQKAIHGIAGVEIDISDKIELNVEPYIKRFTQLINLNRNKLRPGDANYITETGNAYGIDFLLKYNDKNHSVWFTYSLGKIDRNDGFQVYAAGFDRRHNINFLYNYAFGKEKSWEFSTRWNFGTGFPFTQTQGFFNNNNFSGGLDDNYLTSNDNITVIYAEERNGGRLPTFHRLDVSLRKIIKFGKYTRLEATAAVTNVYNRNNIFYLERLTNARIDQLPIMPSMSLALFF